MYIKAPILISILSMSGLAQGTESRDQTSSYTAPCLACSFSMAPESKKAGLTDICDDLFGASCLGANGKPKYSDRSKTLPQELMKPIKEARNKTAQAMGFKDFDAAIRAKFKDEGLDLIAKPEPDAWKSLKKENIGPTFGSGDAGEKLYSAVEACQRDLKALQTIDFSSMKELSELQSVGDQFKSFQLKNRQMLLRVLAKDIPVFIKNEIGNKCSSLKSSPATYKREENQQAFRACSNVSQIRSRAINLFRLEGTPEYKKLAEKFVRENMIPDLKHSSTSPFTNAPVVPALPEKSELEKLREQIQASSYGLNNYCSSLSSALQNAGNKVFGEFVNDINKQRTTVESVIDSFYSDDKRKIADQMLSETRADIQSLVGQFVKDPTKKAEIVDGYAQLKLFWMEKPPESAYKKNDRGFLVLDEEKATPKMAQEFNDDVFTTFSDPSLSSFTSLNANYLPTVNIGTFKNAERVNMLPGFIYMLDKNPYSFLAVTAHEAGHKVGPEVSRINGYDLRPEYKDLLACFKDKKSIKMIDAQADETIADYISSEVLAMQISKLPPEKRRQALMSSIEHFCIFDDAQQQTHSVSCKAEHPENSLRISGIYGANPNIRKTIGCEVESPKFRTCGLNVLLQGSESHSSNSSLEKSSQPNGNVK